VPKSVNDTPAERHLKAIFEGSLKRVKRQGLPDEEARGVARVVAERATARTKAPDLKSDKDFATVVAFVCRGLTEGKSFYDLIGEKPYLATGRMDRLVATAAYVKPPVPVDTASLAKRLTKLERLSGAVAVVFMAVALATLGPWPALGVGIAVAMAAEVYVQMFMPASFRLVAAQARLPYVVGVVAVGSLGYLGYGWLKDSSHTYLYGGGLLVGALVVAFIVPGLTLALLVSLRERKWRRGLENRLVQVLKERSVTGSAGARDDRAGGSDDAGDSDAGAPSGRTSRRR
jgi:hypothetical protein